jgi:adenosylhomocysteine nucleosidase
MWRTDVAFLVAMTEEIEGIFDLGEWERAGDTPFEVYGGGARAGGGAGVEAGARAGAVIVHTGIGTTNAAAAAQFTLDRFDPRRIVNLGLVGCLNSGIGIGAVHSVETCAFFDVDATVFGYKIGQIPRTSVTEYELRGQVAGLQRARLISGDTFVTDPNVFHPDLVGFAADFVDMELAAIAHTLYRNEVLARLESYKSPSDYCNDASTDAFAVNMPKALASLAAVAREVLVQGVAVEDVAVQGEEGSAA